MSDQCKGFKLGTKSQEETLKNMLTISKIESWSTIKILTNIQDIFGYLPECVLRFYSEFSGTPISEIYGVATFYTQFSFKPKGKFVISICLGTACYVNGGQDVLDKFCELLKIKPGESTADAKFSIDQTRCLGCCGIAPVVMVNDKTYKTVKTSDVSRILAEYRGA